MSNHDRSNHDRRIMSENPGVYIAMKSAVRVLARLRFGKHNSGVAQHNFGQGNFGLSGVVTQ